MARWLLMLVICLLPGTALALPQGFEQHVFNGRPAQSLPEGITRFEIFNFDCSPKDYGDGRGESNCFNGNVSSRLAARRQIAAGETVEYGAEIRVDPGFAYRGDRLNVMMWQRIVAIKNEMYFLRLDARHGLTFLGKTCAGPEAFGSWVRFSLKVHWADAAEGFFQVECDGRIIAAWQGANLVPPDCGTRGNDECFPELQDLRQPVQWQIGPSMGGRGQAGAPGQMGKFEPFQDDGLRIDMRNLYLGPIRPAG